MPWVEFDELREFLDKHCITPKSSDCYDCGAKPGEIHNPNCDVQRCSVCGGQRLQCSCRGHDPAFARWTGFWPGELECIALGLMAIWQGTPPVPGWGLHPIADHNRFAVSPYPNIFFVKPKAKKKTKAAE